MSTNVKSLHYHLFIFFFIASLLFSICSADVRYTTIEAPIEPPNMVNLIDVFVFSDIGRIELNITNLSIVPITNNTGDIFNLSRIGFFIATSRKYANYDNTTSSKCSLDDTPIYTLDMLPSSDWLKNTSINIVVDHNQTIDDCQEFSLYFQNCLSSQLQVSMNVRSGLYNLYDTIFVGGVFWKNYWSELFKTHLLFINFGLIFIYFNMFCKLGAYILKSKYTNSNDHDGADYIFMSNDHDNSDGPQSQSPWVALSPIHFVVLVALLLKLLGLTVEMVHRCHIMNTGDTTSQFSFYMAFISEFFYETPVLVLAILTLGGWPQVNPKLNARNILFLIAALPYQLFITNLKISILYNNGPCSKDCHSEILVIELCHYAFVCVMFYPHYSRTLAHIIQAGLALIQVGLADGKKVSLKKKTMINHVRGPFFIYILFSAFNAVVTYTMMASFMIVIINQIAMICLYCEIVWPLPLLGNQVIANHEDEEEEEEDEEKAASQTV